MLMTSWEKKRDKLIDRFDKYSDKQKRGCGQ